MPEPCIERDLRVAVGHGCLPYRFVLLPRVFNHLAVRGRATTGHQRYKGVESEHFHGRSLALQLVEQTIINIYEYQVMTLYALIT